MAVFSADWSRLKEKPGAVPWYEEVLWQVQHRVDASLARGLDVPEEPGNWLHKYVCQETWLPLRYNPSDPVNHTSLLGKTYRGEPFDGGWRVWRHRELADTARDAALLFKLYNRENYFEAVKTILLNYVARYETFAGDEDAEAWMTKGRAFNQALSEAIWAVPLVQAYGLVEADLAETHRQTVCQGLLRPLAETLVRAHDSLIEQGKVESNYVAWLVAALGLIGFVTDDKDLVHRSIEGEGGFKAHLDNAIFADGLEYEGTPYYHNFVALAYTNLAEAALANGINLYEHRGSNGQAISSLWEAFAALAYPDGTVPELNDGSYWQESIYDSEICDVYEVASVRAPQADYAWFLQQAYERRGEKRGSWAALLFANEDFSRVPPPNQVSVCLKDSGVAVLKNQGALAACIPYGNFAGSHSHLDRLALSIWPFSQDAGTPLYGVEARVSWYQQTFAHNTVVVDKHSQNKASGCLQAFSGDSVELSSENLYDGVGVTRAVTLREDTLLDHFVLASDTRRIFDWLCHAEDNWQFEGLEFIEVGEAYSEAGAGVFVDIRAKATVTGSISASTTYGGKTYGLELSADQPFELLLATCPGRSQQPHQKRHMLIARIAANHAEYTATYRATS